MYPRNLSQVFLLAAKAGSLVLHQPASLLEEFRFPGQQLDNSGRKFKDSREKQGRIQQIFVELPLWVKPCLGEGDTELVKTRYLIRWSWGQS